MEQAVGEFNKAQDAKRAGTATDTDLAGMYADVKTRLDEAVSISGSGALHDLAVTASTGVGQARVALLSGGDATVGANAAGDAMSSAAPMCNGK